MITKEDIEKLDDEGYALPRYGYRCSQCGVNWSELLKERDEILGRAEQYRESWESELKKALKLEKERDEALRRGDAYRKLFITTIQDINTKQDESGWTIPVWQDVADRIDKEAAKILEREAKSTEVK